MLVSVTLLCVSAWSPGGSTDDVRHARLGLRIGHCQVQQIIVLFHHTIVLKLLSDIGITKDESHQEYFLDRVKVVLRSAISLFSSGSSVQVCTRIRIVPILFSNRFTCHLYSVIYFVV